MSENIIRLVDLDEPDYLHESMLDDSIQFPMPVTRYGFAPQYVFLTGTTGLLGAFLLEEWLRTTSATMVCLTRADSDELAKKRIINHLVAYGLWRDAYADRIIGLAGDISQPSFGLDQASYMHWAERIDLVCHSAGSINMRQPYAKLKSVNVNGVVEAMRLAATVYTKPFHFVSSIAVFYSDAHPADKVLLETEIPRYHPSLKGDYGKSKWVADRLVAAAQEKGLPAVIYRPTRIMGHSQTGALNDTSEILPNLIRCCILLGLYPDWEIEVTWVPVDYVSTCIVRTSEKEAACGKSLHLYNPVPVEWSTLMNHFREAGYDLVVTTYDNWRQEVKKRSLPGSPEREFFAGILLAFTGLHYLFHTRPSFDCRQLADLYPEGKLHCPPIDRAMIHAYARYWEGRGFLPAAKT